MSTSFHCRVAGLALVLSVLMGLFSLPAPAAEPVRENTSLKFVPEGASFYTTCLRNREQFDAFVNSNAYKRLVAMPALQMAIAQVQALWNDSPSPELAMFKEQLALPENKELLAVLADAASHEIFLYGDSGYAELLDLANQINRINSAAQLEALRTGEEPPAVMARQILAYLEKNGDKLKVPDTVIGFKLTDVKRAEGQVARLEKHLGDALAGNPTLKMRLKREKIAGADFLSFYLDGTLIPWDEIPREELGKDKEAFEKLAAQVKKMTVVISVGVREGYLLLSAGDTSEHLASLGKGKLLADRPELAPLYKAGDKRFTSIGYVSEAFMKKAADASGQFDDLVNMAKQGLPLSGLEEKLQKELIADAEALAADIKKSLPKPGAQMEYSYLTPRGYESFGYDWSEHKGIDGSKPLTILDHVGGDPIFFYASREKTSPDDYAMLTKWGARGVYYFEQIALKELDEKQREIYAKVKKEAEPLLKRFGVATSDMLMPALADGQGAMVLEAKTTSKAWHTAIPPSAKPLPLPEMAMVVGVSDAALLYKACSEYFAIVQEGLDKLHKAAPDEVPEIKLPGPQVKPVAGGRMFSYELPDAWGVDKQVVPNAGLSKNIGVLSYSPAQTERLLTPTPVPAIGPLAKRSRPLAAASSFNFPAFIDMLSPWIDYGFDMAAGLQIADEGEGDLGAGGLVLQADPGSVKFIREQVAVVLEVLKCFRGGSSVSYFEGPALVTHSEMHFQDLK
jgi:hypothetical protein